MSWERQELHQNCYNSIINSVLYNTSNNNSSTGLLVSLSVSETSPNLGLLAPAEPLYAPTLSDFRDYVYATSSWGVYLRIVVADPDTAPFVNWSRSRQCYHAPPIQPPTARTKLSNLSATACRPVSSSLASCVHVNNLSTQNDRAAYSSACTSVVAICTTN